MLRSRRSMLPEMDGATSGHPAVRCGVLCTPHSPRSSICAELPFAEKEGWRGTIVFLGFPRGLGGESRGDQPLGAKPKKLPSTNRFLLRDRTCVVAVGQESSFTGVGGREENGQSVRSTDGKITPCAGDLGRNGLHSLGIGLCQRVPGAVNMGVVEHLRLGTWMSAIRGCPRALPQGAGWGGAGTLIETGTRRRR
jgi:hypothetical protein